MEISYQEMTKVLPECELGEAKITHVTVDRDASAMTAIRAIRDPGSYVAEGTYCQLHVGRSLMMSDTRMEKRSNLGVLMNARGSVLIAGLGIGLILLPLLKDPQVEKITVIEKSADVIKLVEPYLRKAAGENASKLTVICADIFVWEPPKGQKWDTIYFDIWADICEDNLKEMAKLHQKFARRKTPGAWMDSWQKPLLQAQKRREARQSSGWY